MSELDATAEPESSDPTGKRRKRQGLLIPWPALTLALAVVTLASIGTLVIVATISDADALATVALVLAILAFGSQLIVTAAQTMSANEQYRQVNRLYEDTRAVLLRIRTQSKMLLSNQSDQFNKILDHVLSPGAIESAVAEARGEIGDAGAESEGESGPSADLGEVAEVAEVAKKLRAEAERQLAEEQARRVDSTRPFHRSPYEKELRRFPSEAEARVALERFLRLSPDAQAYLRNIGEQFTRNPRAGLRTARTVPSSGGDFRPYIKELASAGFVTLESLRREGKTYAVLRLTEMAVVAVRFFTGEGVVPDYLREVFDTRHLGGSAAPEAPPA